MPRTAACLAAALALLAAPALRGDALDNYTNRVLAKVPGAPGVQKLRQATPALLAEHAGVLPGTTGALLAVRTNEGRWAALLAQPARQKLPGGRSVPILLLERFVTYKEGQERTVLARGRNVRLFGGFEFNLDMGQVVPASVGGDLRFAAGPGTARLEPVGKAELYLLTRPLPEAAPKKSDRPAAGAAFEPRFFNGSYKLYDDGRRSGTLRLKVAANGDVSGAYYSGKDGRRYDVEGKVGNPPHGIRFRITYPRTVQDFRGWLFTGDGRALTGYATLQGRQTGFYAVRED
jgi:hypothetical protein